MEGVTWQRWEDSIKTGPTDRGFEDMYSRAGFRGNTAMEFQLP
jgi:hypothetical protein